MHIGFELLAACVLVAWSVWRVLRVVKSLMRRASPLSVSHARALLWPGLVLSAVLGWFINAG